jgi:glycosyltransferase 2 family protein
VLLSVLVGLGVSALFSWLALKDVDWEVARQAFAVPRWGWVAAFVAVVVFIQLVRMARWSLLLHALGERRLGRTLAVGAVGLTAIFLLPARLGELARPLLISGKGGVSFGEASATVVVERLVDGVLVGLLILGVGFWVEDSLPNASTIRVAGLLFGLGFFAAGTVVFVLARFSAASTRLLERLLGRWPRLSARLTGLIARFEAGLFALVRSRHIVSYLGLSALIWLVNGLSALLMFEAFGLSLSVQAAFVVLAAQAVGVLVPAGPTAVGTFHYAVMWATSLYGLTASAGLQFAVALHLALVGGNLLIGLLGVLGGGLRTSRRAVPP